MQVGKHVGLLCREFAVEPVQAKYAFVIVKVYPNEIKVAGLVYEELPEPLTAHEDKAVGGVGLAERV